MSDETTGTPVAANTPTVLDTPDGAPTAPTNSHPAPETSATNGDRPEGREPQASAGGSGPEGREPQASGGGSGPEGREPQASGGEQGTPRPPGTGAKKRRRGKRGGRNRNRSGANANRPEGESQASEGSDDEDLPDSWNDAAADRGYTSDDALDIALEEAEMPAKD